MKSFDYCLRVEIIACLLYLLKSKLIYCFSRFLQGYVNFGLMCVTNIIIFETFPNKYKNQFCFIQPLFLVLGVVVGLSLYK